MGDEIILPTNSFAATAMAVERIGAIPHFVDPRESDFLMDSESLAASIGKKTKAIVPVHLFGQCANMEAIMEVAKKHNLFVIEDTAQAIGADYFFEDGRKQKAGTIGTIGCTSFFPSKNLGCYGDGGAMFTNDDELAAKIRMIANHGQSVQYVHDSIGVNSRLDSIQAAVLRIKLRDLDNYAKARNRAATFYDIAFGNNSKLKTPARAIYSNHVFHQYTLQINGIDRNAFRDFLSKKDIPAMIYYPIPLHLQKAYLDARYTAGDFPITEKLCASVVSLPMHTELDDETLKYITSSILEFCNK